MGIFQLKIALRDIAPPIWRHVLGRGDTRLGRLHDALLESVGGHFGPERFSIQSVNRRLR